MNKLKMQSADIVADNVQKIATLFPRCVTEILDKDGKQTLAIDFDKLKDELSKDIVEGDELRYQFTWPNKRDAIHLANTPTTKTLRPCREESVDFDKTQNLYIEGDNLEVLKCLRNTYLNKVKVIYIDPPYNTGNDFIYNDKFDLDKDEYLENSGQFDDEGNQLVANTESNGRFHTDWLNMMYPRLKVARDLLKDDGVIFISIDDNEVKNLRNICDEVFGESSFVAQFPWRKRTAKSDVPYGVSQDYEWIICYAKSDKFQAAVQGNVRKYYETPDLPNRPWRIHELTKQTTASERPNSFFTIVDPKNGKEYPATTNRVWIITKDTIKGYMEDKRIIFPGDYDFLSISRPVFRYFKEDDMKKAGKRFGYVALSTKLPKEIGLTQDGTKAITELFGSKVFGYPKPVALIQYLLKASTSVSDEEDIILDFFSGSATTAEAVFRLNIEDNKRRKFILVQCQEPCSENSEAFKEGFKNICEIGKERIRRVGNKIKSESLFFSDDHDIGLRVLKLDSSNMRDVYYTPNETTPNLFTVDNVKADRTGLDLLFQVMLEHGIELSSSIEEISIANKQVYKVKDNYLIACFDDNIDDELIVQIAKMHPYFFVMKDSSVQEDAVRDNFEQIFKQYSKDTECEVI